MDGIYVNGSRAKFPSDSILSDIDSTLTVENTVPDSKVVGDRIGDNETSIIAVNETIGSETMGTDATTLTGAIAEHEGDITSINDAIGSETMGTDATTLTGAIAEHETDITDINDVIGSDEMGTDATTIKGAIAEHETDISSINDTIGSETMGTDATTITGAIAEHEGDIATLLGRDIKLVPASLGAQTASDAGVISVSNVDVSNDIPSGYTALCAIPHDSGSYAFHYYLCTMNSSTTVSARLMRMYGFSTAGTTPKVLLLCVKNF